MLITTFRKTLFSGHTRHIEVLVASGKMFIADIFPACKVLTISFMYDKGIFDIFYAIVKQMVIFPNSVEQAVQSSFFETN